MTRFARFIPALTAATSPRDGTASSLNNTCVPTNTSQSRLRMCVQIAAASFGFRSVSPSTRNIRAPGNPRFTSSSKRSVPSPTGATLALPHAVHTSAIAWVAPQ